MDLLSQGALRAAKVVWRPGHGGFAFTVVCKATFELRPEVSPLAAAQEPIVEADVYTGPGGGLALASELVPFKKRPEVLVVGHAYAPEERPVQALVARLAVGEIDKALQMVGDRGFGLDGRLGEPESFRRMPLVWERAAGGPGTFNPVGRPLGDAAQVDVSGRVPAPNLLPVGMVLRSRGDHVPPVGFGPIAPLWPSRAACLQRHAAGWDPSRWYERPLPDDIDLGYLNAAPMDQQRTLPFGEEAIYLENLHPMFARLSTRLAPVAPVATVDHGAGPQALQLRCDTLVIDTDRGLAMLVWRAHVLLDHPARPGRVVVTGPAAPEAAPSTWAHDVTDGTATVMAAAFVPTSVVLPFSDAAARAPSAAPLHASAGAQAHAAPISAWHAAQSRFEAAAPQVADHPLEGTQAPPLASPAPALPFAASWGQNAQRLEPWRAESAVALPFVPPSAGEAGHGSPAPRLNSRDVTPWQAAGTPWVESAGIPVPSPAAQPTPVTPSPWTAQSNSTAAFAPQPAAPLPPYVPWSHASAGHHVPTGLLADHQSPRITPPPSPASERPTPPPLLGALTLHSKQPAEAQGTQQTPLEEAGVIDGSAPVVGPALDVDFDTYPPARCGALAARLACDERSTGDILCAEGLDAAQWQRVHEHWLHRINGEAARSKKQLLSAYDVAYVSTLEAQRSPIALEDYALLAEAAERGAVTEALTERGLPEGAWPHIHRVWIGRMASDVRLAKQTRAAIDAVRAAASLN